MSRLRVALIATVPLFCASLVAAACGDSYDGTSSGTDAGGGSETSTTPPTTPPTPPPAPTDAGGDADAEAGPLPQQFLYIGNDKPDGGVWRYALPLGDASVPEILGHGDTILAVTVAPNGDLVTGSFAGKIEIFHPPFSRDQTPATVFANGATGTTGQIAFSSDGGTMFAGGASTSVNAFDQPYLDASVPAKVITDPDGGITTAYGVAVDPTGKLYVAGANRVLVFPPPYSAPSVVTPALPGTAYRKALLSATQLFVACVGSPLRVDVYNLPITNASTPAFSITSGIDNPEALALDNAGNLYVGNLTNSMVNVYTPPVSSGSAPARSMQVAPTNFALFGMAIAP